LGTYSIAEALDWLSQLIDEALAGEEVTITRDDKPVAELRAIEPARRGLDPDFLAHLAARAKTRQLIGENAVDILRRMRDGEDE